MTPGSDSSAETTNAEMPAMSLLGVFLVFLRLGLTSFGGPVAHLAYFRDEFVARRRWLDEQTYAELVALCQFLPGPASSQVGIGIGLLRAGWAGAVVAWLGFTLPSALLMAGFAAGVVANPAWLGTGWLAGVKLAAVAIVAQAVWSMARSHCPDGPRRVLALAALVLCLSGSGALLPPGVLLGAGLVGGLWLRAETSPGRASWRALSPRVGYGLLLVFAAGLAWSLFGAEAGTSPLASGVYRAGALVFGGGHVVLPLLQQEFVPGLMDRDTFIAGYGMAQAVPGPLFSFAAYLGTVAGGWSGAAMATVAVFLPGALLVLGVMPFWSRWRVQARLRAALSGVNAAVVGLLAAAFIDPIGRGSLHSAADIAIALGAFLALQFARCPSWLLVGACALAGQMSGLAG